MQRPLESLPLAPLISYNHVYKIKAIRRLEFTLRKLAADVRGESSPIASFRAQIRFYKQRKIQLSFRRKPIV